MTSLTPHLPTLSCEALASGFTLRFRWGNFLKTSKTFEQTGTGIKCYIPVVESETFFPRGLYNDAQSAM